MATRCRSAPWGPFRHLGAAGWALAAVAAASACAGTGDGPLVSDEAPDEAAAAATSSPAPEDPTAEAPTTTAGPPPSEGTVDIGDAHYQFTVTCDELGAGEVRVKGTGEGPDSDGTVELLLLTSLVDPYVGLRLADGTLFEPSLDSPLDLYVQDDVIRASAIRFVRDLDLETGTATDAGFGELEIHCYEYSREAPA